MAKHKATTVIYTTSSSSAPVPTNWAATAELVYTAAKKATPNKEVTNAVYGYIRAVRSLGKTSVTVRDVSEALNLPDHAVIAAMETLRSKGVNPK